MVGQAILDSSVVNGRFACRYVNLSTSEKMEEVGRFSFHKIKQLRAIRRKVMQEVAAFSPDLVYLTPASSGLGFLKDQWLVSRLRKKGCRIVLHFHNKGVRDNSRRWWYDRLYRRFFRDARIILLSERLYQDVSPYVDREDVWFCPNGAASCPQSPDHSGTPLLLFLSNLIPSKGPLVLLDACQILKRRGCPFRCVFVGKETAGISAARMREEIASRGLEDTVRFDGPLYGDEKWKVLSQADIFVLPTFSDCFPLVILEAFAAGLPVVTTEEGAIPDIVTEGENGLLCRPEDPEALARALEKLLDQPELRSRMGRANRLRYLAEYTPEVFENRFADILSEMLHA